MSARTNAAGLIPALSLVFALACAGDSPEQTRYLWPVSAPDGVTRVDPPVRIGLGRVEVAPYLSGSGLMVETGDGEVRAARQHLWAEPLDHGLRRHLRAELSRALGYEVDGSRARRQQWAYAVEVGIDRLHGTLEGEAILIAQWSISPVGAGEDSPAVAYRISRREPLSEPGYAALFDAQVRLTRALAAAIAESINETTSGTADPAKPQ